LQLVFIKKYLFNYQTSKYSTSVENKFSQKEKTYFSNTKKIFGGDDRSRTCDFLNANQALSQLSYIPIYLVAGTGFEPATFGL
jgi:hypothetical protein